MPRPRTIELADGSIVPMTEAQELEWDALEAADAAAESAAQRKRIIADIQARLDALAQDWGYDDAKSAVSYLGDPFPRFAAEAAAIRDWRSATWAYVGTCAALDPQPTPETFAAGLPPPPIRPNS